MDREVAEGRVASQSAFLLEAARRNAQELLLESDVVAEARAGIADVVAGRFVTTATPEDAAALHERTIERLRAHLAADKG